MAKTKSNRRAPAQSWEERFAARFERQPAQITHAQMFAIEEMFQNPSFGPWRRLALGTLARSGQQLIDAMDVDRETVIEFARGAAAAKRYAAKLRELADLMDTASTRMSVALCSREDMTDVLAMAQAVDEVPEVLHG